MAYFIVIGTSNEVKNVVDEVKRAHLQHNVITSGCILSEDDSLYYHWDVYNENGNKTIENTEPVALHDALTNQISQFRTLLPTDAIPNVFIVSKCFDEKESETLQMVCDELYGIGGAMLSGLLVDIVLLGYDLTRPEDVTKRPHWRVLESLRGLGANGNFHTDVLYINNMDYMGAATNVDSRVLSKFLCHWSKMVCSGGYDPKATVHSRVYSIGMSEHQYDFRDLNEFFKLAAEERLLNRTLNDHPSADTQRLIDANYFKKIDLDLPWIDGLYEIQSLWREYCTTEWDPSKPLSANPYSVAQQEQLIATYLNKYLKLYIAEEQREVDILKEELTQQEAEKSMHLEQLEKLRTIPEGEDNKEQQIANTESRLCQIEHEIDALSRKIQAHESNIRRNTFLDAEEFHLLFGNVELITEEDEENYNTNKSSVMRMLDYVKSDAGIRVMREAIDRATISDPIPQPYPASEVTSMGRITKLEVVPEEIPALAETPEPGDGPREEPGSEKRSGCLGWIKSLFGKKSFENSFEGFIPPSEGESNRPAAISDAASKFLNEKLNKSVAALKRADEVRIWWSRLVDLSEKYQRRIVQCKLLMDGEKDTNGNYIWGKEGYRPAHHPKSVSLIDMERVRLFRDTNAYYREMIDRFLHRWFDSSVNLAERMTMLELIKHQVLDPLVGRFHTLHWDGNSPFVKEMISDEEMHEFIESDLRQSKPFVEYIKIHESNLESNLNINFFSNNPNIPTGPSEYRSKYQIGTDSITPVYLEDFVNSLCVIQVMDIPQHVDALKDFKPKRDASLSKLRVDIKAEAAAIVAGANTVEDKARAIYDWICGHIAYDTTKQIHDVETCWKTKRGVCQAYSELFCYMAEAVGLTADVVVGMVKNPDGTISGEKHSWVFVYTQAYDGILIDPTWGAGSVDGVTFVKNQDTSAWFDVSPYWMIFSHFPNQHYWTKLDIDITEDQFCKIPFVVPTKETDGKDDFFESVSKI